MRHVVGEIFKPHSLSLFLPFFEKRRKAGLDGNLDLRVAQPIAFDQRQHPPRELSAPQPFPDRAPPFNFR
jgi:hypothetical protein